MTALMRIVRDVVFGVVALVVAAEALISLPTLLGDLSTANIWVHHHLSSRVGEVIGGLVLGVALAGFIIEIRAGSKRRQRIAGGTLLVIIGATALIAFPFGDLTIVRQNPAPPSPSVGISSNKAVWKPLRIDLANAAENSGKQAGSLLGSAQNSAAHNHSFENSTPNPKALASACGCQGRRPSIDSKPEESRVQVSGEETPEPPGGSVDESTDEESVAVENEAEIEVESSTKSSGSTAFQSREGSAVQSEAAAAAAEAQAEAAAEAASAQAEAATARAEAQAGAAEARAEAAAAYE